VKISWQARCLKWVLRLVVRRQRSSNSVEAVRKKLHLIDRLMPGLPVGVQSREAELAGVPVQRIRSSEQTPVGTILFLHGGAWCFETPRLHANLAARLALALNMESVIPHYRLAPEHPFPAGHQDCIKIWNGLLQEGVQPGKVILMGDSAGGALALSLLAHLRDGNLELPACALLMSPATDLASTGRSMIDNAKSDDMFKPLNLMMFRHWYLGDISPTDPMASPYWGDFSGFPPLMFQVSGSELLLDNSVMAEKKARHQSVETQISIWPDMPHDFPLFKFLPESAKAVDELVEFANVQLRAKQRNQEGS
jgi:monoterpene epsilon-lactone hydrolase